MKYETNCAECYKDHSLLGVKPLFSGRSNNIDHRPVTGDDANSGQQEEAMNRPPKYRRHGNGYAFNVLRSEILVTRLRMTLDEQL